MEERIISSRVVGSANPIARKFRSIKSACSGVGCGFIALVIGLVMVYMSVAGVVENSKTVGALELEKPADVVNEQGMVKIGDKPVSDEPAVFNYTECSDKNCIYLTDNDKKSIDNLLYYHAVFQRFEVVKEVTTETRTRIVNGEEVEDKVEKIEYKEEWVDKYSEKKWANFSLGEIKVIPSEKTTWMTSNEEKEITNVLLAENVEPLNNYGQIISASIGSSRIKISYAVFSEANLIVVGDISNKQIQGGAPFIITTKSDTELLKDLETAENTQRIVYMVLSWVLTFIGLSMIIAPVIELVDFIPLVGSAAKAVAGIISAVIATIIVVSSWLLMKFWWLILLCLVGLVVLAVVLIMKKKQKRSTEKPMEEKPVKTTT